MKDAHIQILNAQDLSIPLPCPVSWEEMEEQADGNRFCGQCSKTVFDLAGKTRADLEGLFDAHGEQICGNLYAAQLMEAESPQKGPKSGIPNIFKTVAAAAATIAMLHTPLRASEGGGNEKPKTETVEMGRKTFPDPSTNTFLSGVILTQYGGNIGHDLLLSIYHGDTLLETITTQRGLFSLELKDQCRPEDKISLRIPEQKFGKGFDLHRYHARQLNVRLRDSQNLEVKVDHVSPPSHKRLGGVIARPIR